MSTHPQYVPHFRIRINDNELPAAVRASVTSVSYQDGVNEADRVEIELANSNLRWLQGHIRGLGFRPFPSGVKIGPIAALDAAPEGTFDLANKLTLAIGYAPDPLEDVFEGDVTGIEAKFPNGGMPTLRLVAHDYLHRLGEGQYARGFGPLPDFLIAAILSAENVLLPAIDPMVAAASTAIAVVNAIFSGTGRKQVEMSDLDFMKEIAATYDADFWVEGDILYFSRFFKDYTPSLTLKWGESLLDFSPKVSTVGQVVGVAAKFTLREIPLDFVVSVGWDFNREALVLMVVPGAAGTVAVKSFVGPLLTTITDPLATPADITNSALELAHDLRQILNNRLTGTGTAIGDPRIRAGAIIRLEGLGQDFSGDYRIASADHIFGASGYQTKFSVKKEIIP
jgi:Bacteriophage probable baseplate hub protein